MYRLVTFVVVLAIRSEDVAASFHDNFTLDAANRQLAGFKIEHLKPIGLQTTSDGEPIEIRKTISRNSDLFANQNHIDQMSHIDGERIPERVVHAKGIGAYGYFKVTHDVSKYTSADVFNGVGKKTPLVVRFSRSVPNLGGSDLNQDTVGLAIKFYTKEGNLDLLCLQTPVYFYREALNFPNFVKAIRRNPQTNLLDPTAAWDFITLRPVVIHNFLWTQSDYGSPNGYRRMNAFPIHTYEINNKHGKKFYVKFNFRSEQGLDYLSAAENMAIRAEDPDYLSRDLYNAISERNYPSWKLEMDVITETDVKSLDYDPFDIVRMWKNGTFITVPIGRLVLNQTVDNHFKDVELSAYNPANLVPGIPGPVDSMFKSRRFAYRDAQNYRLGRNHHKIEVNTPKYARTYNRDGVAPVKENMKDAPNYYPNTFNGPVPYVDEARPKENLIVLENTAVDLEPAWYFYNHILENDGQRQRLVDNVAVTLVPVSEAVFKRALHLLHLIDQELGERILRSVRDGRLVASNPNRLKENAQCFTTNRIKFLNEIKSKH